MNFPSATQANANGLDFEVILDEAIEPASASPAKPATVAGDSFPGVTCMRIPVGERA